MINEWHELAGRSPIKQLRHVKLFYWLNYYWLFPIVFYDLARTVWSNGPVHCKGTPQTQCHGCTSIWVEQQSFTLPSQSSPASLAGDSEGCRSTGCVDQGLEAQVLSKPDPNQGVSSVNLDWCLGCYFMLIYFPTKSDLSSMLNIDFNVTDVVDQIV